MQCNFLERPPSRNLFEEYHISMHFFWKRSSFISRLKNNIIFSGKRNIIFPDDTRKIIFQCNFFKNIIFSEHLEKENMLFRAVYLNNILRSKNRLIGKFCSYFILPLDIRFIFVSEWSDKNSAMSACLLQPNDPFKRNEVSVLLISDYSDQWSDDDRMK